MTSRLEFQSKLYELEPLDADDDLELELADLYASHVEATLNKSEIELHNYLHDKASQNKKEYHDLVSALLYGVLTEPVNAKSFFQSITYVNRDHFANVITKLQIICNSPKFHLLQPQAREQLFWLVNALTNLNVHNVDTIYLSLLKQIRGGDFSQPNLSLCDQYVKLCERVKPWLDMNPKVIAMTVYTYLRVLADHQRSAQYQALQQKEVRFAITLMREKWLLCVPIGRDLVRVLYDVQSIPEFKQFWTDLLQNPQSLSPKFKGVEVILNSPTPKEFLRSRLTVDMESKLLFILQNLRINQFQRNLTWFTQRYLSTPESEPFYVDIIRYIVAGWYPSNQILQSDIVPRYVVIGSMLRAIKNNTVAMNVKTALILDWLFFKPADNIMFIEPAMLLIERSAERYPSITASMIEFLKRSVDEYFPPMKDYMARCVACGMHTLLSKGVIRSLLPIYKLPTMDLTTKGYMKALFSDFLNDNSGPRQQQQPSESTSTIAAAPNNSTTNTALVSDSSRIIEQAPLGNFPLSASSLANDSDVDAYLYGESLSPTKTGPPMIDESDTTPMQTEAQGEDVENDKDIKKADEEEEGIYSDMEDSDQSMSKPEQSSTPSVVPDATASAISMKETHDVNNQQQMQQLASSTSMMADKDDEVQLEPEVLGDKHIGSPKEPAIESQTNQSEKAQNKDIADSVDFEEEDEKAQAAMESNQSYWIFGDSLKRFRESSMALLKDTDELRKEDYLEHNTVAKRNLKEILAVFLRVAIPPEILAASIGTHVRNMVACNMLSHITTAITKNENEETFVTDTSRDVFDVIMIHYWNACAVKKDTTGTKKLTELMGYLAHQTQIKQRRHIVGMRWWSFIAEQVSESDDVSTWFPTFIQNYQTFVRHAYSTDHSTMNEDKYLKEYLQKDLQMLAESNIEQFNRIITLLYRYIPNITSGNAELLRLTLMMLLPDTMGKIILELHYGYYQVFGEKSTDHQLINASFAFATYETLIFWQLLTAELQGQRDLIEKFFQTPEINQLLRANLKNEIIPSLISLITSVPPSKELIYAIVRIIPKPTSFEKGQQPSQQLQLALALLQHWAAFSAEVFMSSLSELVAVLIDQVELLGDEKETQSMIDLLVVLRTWWDQETTSSTFKENKKLLASLFKLGRSVGYTCPKEWNQQEMARKRKRTVIFDSDEDDDM